MSLPLIAKHLEKHGRGEDTHLVHMTTGELQAMQNLAQKHGGSLTINPHTGLPEAGFLSSVLPMALGAAASAFLGPEMMPLVAGGIGLADYAMTGSLTQGLMAGLGAWGGGELAGSLADAGLNTTVQSGGDEAAKQFAQNQAAAQTGPNALTNYSMDTAGNPTVIPSTNTPANIAGNQIGSMNNLTSDQIRGFQDQLAVPGSNPADVVRSAGAANAAFNAEANPMTTMGQGISNAQGTGAVDSLKNFGQFAKNNMAGMAALANAGLSGLGAYNQLSVPGVQTASNPFGLKTIPKDANGNPIFNAMLPAQPSPHYQAQYPNYQQNPYQGVVSAADGGQMQSGAINGDSNGMLAYTPSLMQNQNTPQSTMLSNTYNIPSQMPVGNMQTANSMTPMDNRYTGLPMKMNLGGVTRMASGSDPYGQELSAAQEMMAGLQAATKRPVLEQGQAPDVGVYQLNNTDYAQTSPVALIKKSKIGVAKGLQPTANLGDYEIKPAAQAQAEAMAQQDIAQNSQMPTTAKEGGLMAHKHIVDGHLGAYSDGGHLLKGPGDGVSDGIPATIGGKQPARLADGEFVIPARIVSELGNGSTDAGAKRLYAMMDRIKAARAKSKDIAADTKAYKYLPA